MRNTVCVAIALVGLFSLVLALTARVVSLAIDGISPTAFPPMIVEAVMVAILLIGRRALKNPA